MNAHWQISQWLVAQSRQLIGMLQQPVISITIDATAELPVRMLTISGIRDAKAKALAAELDLIEINKDISKNENLTRRCFNRVISVRLC
ncbi:hypothetical protein L9G15_15875 [Shewanella sp. A3A]|nr:hypothetical protein [Shewanella ferrihydritica]